LNHFFEATISFLSGGLTKASVWQLIAYTLVTTHVTIASVTIFLHRCQAHRALELHPAVSHFFRFWLWLSTGQVTKEWAAVHRKHHAKVESADDPHSPVAHGIGKVLLQGTELYRAEARNPETLSKYGHGTPDDWLEHHVYTPLQKYGIVLMLAIDLALFGLLPGALIWGVQMAWIPFWAAGVINGLGHFWGYRNFDCADASTNLSPWGILIGGEELHNNHHSFATSARLSNKWYEFDIGWMYIRILAALGFAKIKKVAPIPKLGALRPVVDVDTLQAVITHRYDVLARYAKSMRQVYREELGKLHDRAQFAGLKRWLAVDAKQLPGDLRGRLDAMLAQSRPLATLYAMRGELASLWSRTNASREQLVKDLQDWCQRAEASGIRQLRDISLRVRSYAVA
jgi:stearoyl-CoA desaturase (delta-9 desaturase)